MSAFGGKAAVELTRIDLAQSFYLASNLATTVFPVFQGGMLRINVSGTYTNNFMLNNSATNTINAYGNIAKFSGVLLSAVSLMLSSLHPAP